MTAAIAFWSIVSGVAFAAALVSLGDTIGGAIYNGVVFCVTVLICAWRTTGRTRVLKIVAALGAGVICLQAAAWAISVPLGDVPRVPDSGWGVFMSILVGAQVLFTAPILNKLSLSRGSDEVQRPPRFSGPH